MHSQWLRLDAWIQWKYTFLLPKNEVNVNTKSALETTFLPWYFSLSFWGEK